MPPCLLLYSVFGYSVFHAYDVDEIRSERAQRPSATSFSTSLASVRSSSSSLSTPSPLPWTRSTNATPFLKVSLKKIIHFLYLFRFPPN
ncbi:hypothetical protein BHM03_00061009 [Ensete ventricosum]|nr:hypothetical protein BHM03_00061009 [Ensete ventricosum]